MQVCQTQRLVLRHFTLNDAPFIQTLLNDQSFIDNIGDKEIHSSADAIQYLNDGPLLSYQQNGFGLSIVTLKETGEPIGMCGLIKRDELEHVDLGYALLSEHHGKGYAKEAASSILTLGFKVHKLNTIIAVTHLNNVSSSHLLLALGFSLIRPIVFKNIKANLYQITA